MSSPDTFPCSSRSQAIFLTSMLMALIMRFALLGLRLDRRLFSLLRFGLLVFKTGFTDNLQSVHTRNKCFPSVRFTGIAAALYYLRHLRSCAASASGCKTSGGSTGRTSSEMFGLAWFGSACLSFAWLGLACFGLAWFGSPRLGLA